MSADNDSSVISGLRATRAHRQPPTRRVVPGAVAAPHMTDTPAGSPAAGASGSREPASVLNDDPTPTRASSPKQTAAPRRDVLTIALDDPTTNYAVRVRRTLDDLLSQQLGELRARGTRSSKVEITELLLWELAQSTPSQLDERLAEFRRHAPR